MRIKLKVEKEKVKNKKRIVCGDLHLDDKLDNQYRWEFIEWLKNLIQKNKIESVYFLGDITEKKDRHSSGFVNKITDMFVELSKLCKVFILKGNHDFDKDENTPFFKFFSHMQSIKFIVHPIKIGNEYFIPFSRKGIKEHLTRGLRKYDFVYLHTDLIGARVSEHHTLEKGMDIKDFKDIDTHFISGHIHSDQKGFNNFEFIRTPYPINFGDDCGGGVVFIDECNRKSNIDYSSLKRWSLKIKSIDELESVEFEKGDHVKIEVAIHTRDFHRWYDIRDDIKKFCIEKEVVLFSVTMKPIKKKVERKKGKAVQKQKFTSLDILKKYSEQEKLDKKQILIGEEFL